MHWKYILHHIKNHKKNNKKSHILHLFFQLHTELSLCINRTQIVITSSHKHCNQLWRVPQSLPVHQNPQHTIYFWLWGCKLHFQHSSSAYIEIFHCLFIIMFPDSYLPSKKDCNGKEPITKPTMSERWKQCGNRHLKGLPKLFRMKGNLRRCSKSSEHQHSFLQLAWLANS